MDPTNKIQPTDTKFYTSPDAGHPECLCSRCGRLIERDDFLIRMWPEDPEKSGDWEMRFHIHCLFPQAEIIKID